MDESPAVQLSLKLRFLLYFFFYCSYQDRGISSSRPLLLDPALSKLDPWIRGLAYDVDLSVLFHIPPSPPTSPSWPRMSTMYIINPTRLDFFGVRFPKRLYPWAPFTSSGWLPFFPRLFYLCGAFPWTDRVFSCFCLSALRLFYTCIDRPAFYLFCNYVLFFRRLCTGRPVTVCGYVSLSEDASPWSRRILIPFPYPGPGFRTKD